MEQAASPVYGRVGGVALDATLDGLAATRETSGRPAHTVVVAHSYGSQVVAGAADRPGRLAADAVVLAGSPGLEGTADDLEVEDVYAAIGGSDPIWLAPAMPDVPGFPVFATAVWSPGYGATPLPAEEGMGHSEYYDTDRPTVAAIGEVLADVRHP
ncbi:alpha/beta hydrolase [Blastococcus sp. SYSU D00695]